MTAAKATGRRECGIDFHAGPSEIVIWSDAGKSEWIAADLIAQAEHDPDARRLVRHDEAGRWRGGRDRGPSPTLRVSQSRRRRIEANGAILIALPVRRPAVVNRLAPEHLVCDNAAMRRGGRRDHLRRPLERAGRGRLRDRIESRAADRRRRAIPGGLTPADFVRTFTVQTLTEAGIAAIGPSAIRLAEAEGLTAHAESIRLRTQA